MPADWPENHHKYQREEHGEAYERSFWNLCRNSSQHPKYRPFLLRTCPPIRSRVVFRCVVVVKERRHNRYEHDEHDGDYNRFQMCDCRT